MVEQVDKEEIRKRIKTKFRNIQRFGVVAKKSPDWIYKRLYKATPEGLQELVELVEKTQNVPTNYELSAQDLETIKTAINEAVVAHKMTLNEWCESNDLSPFWVKKRLLSGEIRLKSSERLKKLLRVLDLEL